jgi:hypothetical protein
LCWDCFHNAVSVWWHPAQASLPTKAAGTAVLARRVNPPSVTNSRARLPIATAASAAKTTIRGFDFHQRGGGVWAPSLREPAENSIGLDVAGRFDSLSLLPARFLLRATNSYPLDG